MSLWCQDWQGNGLWSYNQVAFLPLSPGLKRSSYQQRVAMFHIIWLVISSTSNILHHPNPTQVTFLGWVKTTKTHSGDVWHSSVPCWPICTLSARTVHPAGQIDWQVEFRHAFIWDDDPQLTTMSVYEIKVYPPNGHMRIIGPWAKALDLGYWIFGQSTTSPVCESVSDHVSSPWSISPILQVGSSAVLAVFFSLSLSIYICTHRHIQYLPCVYVDILLYTYTCLHIYVYIYTVYIYSFKYHQIACHNRW